MSARSRDPLFGRSLHTVPSPIHITAGGWMFQQQEGQPSIAGAAERRASHLTVFTLLLCTVRASKCEERGGCQQGCRSAGFLSPHPAGQQHPVCPGPPVPAGPPFSYM